MKTQQFTMSAFIIGIALLTLFLLIRGRPATAQSGGTTERVSIASDGTQGNESSSKVSISYCEIKSTSALTEPSPKILSSSLITSLGELCCFTPAESSVVEACLVFPGILQHKKDRCGFESHQTPKGGKSADPTLPR